MATFCSNCGSPLGEQSAFCASCGARVGGPVQPLPSQPPPPAAPVKGGGALKIVLIVVGVLFVVGVLAVAGVIYAGYRIKNRVEQAARERGVDLSAFSEASRAPARHVDPCSLLTREEASQIVEVQIERAERQGDRCDYYAPASAQQAGQTAESALARLQARSNADARGGAAPKDPRELVRQSGMEDFVKSLGAAQAGGKGPYFTVTVHDDGKVAINTMRLAVGMVSPVKTTEDLKGVADDAVLGPMDSMLMFVKNGEGVEIDLRLVPHGKTRGIEMARRMASRL